MKIQSTGSPAVDAMCKLSITGNVIPDLWYSNILHDNGKPDLLAITLLSDITYWYRPEEIRDEHSGIIIGWKKKFKGDLLQKSYAEYSEKFGESKRSIKAALDHLEKLGIIRKEFRKITTKQHITIPNVMYIELFPAKLEAISFNFTSDKKNLNSESDDISGNEFEIADIHEDNYESTVSSAMKEDFDTNSSQHSNTSCNNDAIVPQISAVYPTTECNTSLKNEVTPITSKSYTNTKTTTETTKETTTETTTEDNHSLNECKYPIFLSCGKSNIAKKDFKSPTLALQNDNDVVRMKQIQSYIDRIKENIEYDYHTKSGSYKEWERYPEIFNLMCDVVCYRTGMIKMGKDHYVPHEQVKSVFLQLTADHILYVIDCLNNTNTKIKKIDDYLIKSLYTSYSTLNNFYLQDIQHDNALREDFRV